MNHRRYFLNWIFLLVTVLLVAGTVQVAGAHAVLMESTPKANSTVKGPDLMVDLRFNDRIDGRRSRLVLVRPNGSTTPLTISKESKPDHLQSSATDLKAGAYKLRWNVLATDGHLTHGEIPFTVS